MKITVVSVAFFVIMSVATVGCQKESITEDQSRVSTMADSRTVGYMVDGVFQTVVIRGGIEWNDFMMHMIALAEEGHSIRVLGGSANTQAFSAKEKVVYTTKDKQAAAEWTLQKINEGYDVEVTYNSQTGEYTCVATR
ncbi:MAG: hypothetical protein IJK84_08435 [Bacteroidales bacterium]|nr:hypothetical protein [Bacteroidales bacterium]